MRFCGWLLALLFLATPVARAQVPDPLAGVAIHSDAATRAADLVVIVSIDGLRADAAYDLPVVRRLQREGAWASHAQTIRRSTTLPSHASMLTGVDVDVHGINFNGLKRSRGYVQFPTIFRVARAAGLHTEMFIGKNKLEHLVEPDGVERVVLAGRTCNGIVARADASLRHLDNGLLFLHFSDPDQAGHERGWMSAHYLAAAMRADECLDNVVRALEARTNGTRRVLLVVTADHGGHARSHGTLLDVDRHIPWVAWGGAAPRNQEITRDLSTMDTAATALTALGLPQTRGMEGRPVHEAISLTDTSPHSTNERRSRAHAPR